MIAQKRFIAKVDKHGPYTGLVAGRCHDWTAAKDKDGYGIFQINGNAVRATRWAWEQEHGPVPDGLELDHLCKRPVCVRPSHLEPVTHKVNVLRGESPAAKQARQIQCLQGHPLFGDNLRITPQGKRDCRRCHRNRERDRRARRRAA